MKRTSLTILTKSKAVAIDQSSTGKPIHLSSQSPQSYSTESKNSSNLIYHDHSSDTQEDMERDLMNQLTQRAKINVFMSKSRKFKVKRGARGGVSDPFPVKLHRMLENIEIEGFSHIVSWQPHGRAFCVHKPKDFVSIVMPKYFRQTKLTSFQRQLNLYGFCRLTKGADAGSYYHELFLRGKSFLTQRMIRTKIKGTGHKAANNPDMEPNFYAMRSLSSNTQTNDKINDSESKSKNQCYINVNNSSGYDSTSSSVSELTMEEGSEKEGDIVSFEGKSFHYLDTLDPLKVNLSQISSREHSTWIKDFVDGYEIFQDSLEDVNFDFYFD